MKRTEMKRGKPLARGQGLSRGSKPMKRTEMKRGDANVATRSPLARRSKARTQQMAEDRVPLVKALVEAGVTCEIGPMFIEAGVEQHCTTHIQGLHERRRSGAGGSRVNRNNLVPACNWCNSHVECEPKLMRELFNDALVVQEGDPEWEQLGRRRDRETPD